MQRKPTLFLVHATLFFPLGLLLIPQVERQKLARCATFRNSPVIQRKAIRTPVARRTSHSSHVARRTSHVARRTSHVARRTSHVALLVGEKETEKNKFHPSELTERKRTLTLLPFPAFLSIPPKLKIARGLQDVGRYRVVAFYATN